MPWPRATSSSSARGWSVSWGRERFQLGKAAFEAEEFASDGLGAVFTENACGKCHGTPILGGGSEIVETRIGRRVRGRFDPLLEFGGPIIQNKAIDARRGWSR